MQRLDLSGNRLKEVPKVALGDLNNLRELSLRNNPIKQILSYDFVRVGKTLSWLDIGQLRQLNHVSTHALNGLASLKVATTFCRISLNYSINISYHDSVPTANCVNHL